MSSATPESSPRERLRDVDANLLVALHALLEDRNLTRAGLRISMSQPAMSAALERLRTHFGDELLLRNDHGFELTPLAERLQPLVGSALEAAEAVIGSHRDFDPAASTKRFTVSMSEYAMTVLAEPLVRLIDARAPRCAIALGPLDMRRDQFEDQLMRRDLVVAPLGYEFPGRVQPIYTDELVCMVAQGHPRLREGGLTREDLAAMPHAVAEFAAAGTQRRPLETALEECGLGDRSVLVRLTSLLTLPYAVAGTDMCAFVPSRLARRCADILGLVVAATPLPPVRITEAAHWHLRRDTDPSVAWLRQLLYDVAVTVEDDLAE